MKSGSNEGLRTLVRSCKTQVRGRITAAIPNPALIGVEGTIVAYARFNPYPITFKANGMRFDLKDDEVEVLA